MMLTIGLLYLALFALSARMQRHRPVLLDTWQRQPFVVHLEWTGWTLFGLSLLSLSLCSDVGMALVAWTGLLPLLAGVVVLGMTYRPALPRAVVPIAAAATLLGLVV